jgi:hypothetical protein
LNLQHRVWFGPESTAWFRTKKSITDEVYFSARFDDETSDAVIRDVCDLLSGTE